MFWCLIGNSTGISHKSKPNDENKAFRVYLWFKKNEKLPFCLYSRKPSIATKQKSVCLFVYKY